MKIQLVLPGLLGLLFIALKLCHQIDWSWWWVTCPLWAVPALLIAFLLVCGAVYLVCAIGAWALS